MHEAGFLVSNPYIGDFGFFWNFESLSGGSMGVTQLDGWGYFQDSPRHDQPLLLRSFFSILKIMCYFHDQKWVKYRKYASRESKREEQGEPVCKLGRK